MCSWDDDTIPRTADQLTNHNQGENGPVESDWSTVYRAVYLSTESSRSREGRNNTSRTRAEDVGGVSLRVENVVVQICSRVCSTSPTMPIGAPNDIHRRNVRNML